MAKVSVKVVGDAEVADRFQSMSYEVMQAADKAAMAAGKVVEGFAKKSFRTVAPGGKGTAMGPAVPGQLTSRSTDLRSGIHTALIGQGRVRIGPGPLKYAAIHEFGGVIVPRTKKALRFQVHDGTWVVTKRVIMPARPYMRPALEKDPDAIRRQILKTLRKELNLN